MNPLKNISQILNRRSYYPDTAKSKWLMILFTVIFISLFLLFFQPFGVNNYDPNETVTLQFTLIISSFGFVVGLIMFINEFIIRKWVLQIMDFRQLLIWLLWGLFSMGTGVFLYYNFLGNFHDLYWSSYFGFLINIATLGAIPFCIILFVNTQLALKKDLDMFRSLQSSNKNPELVLFTGSNSKEEIALPVDHILFIEGHDNYAAIHFDEGEKINKHLVRTTLKRLEVELSHTPLIRCHRSYLVNFLKIVQIIGNQNNMRLKLPGMEKVIPVSKKYSSEISQRIR